MVNQLLIDSNLSIVNAQNEQGQTVLHLACFRGKIEIVEVVLAASNIDMCLRDKKGCTPLHIACQRGFLGIVELLVRILSFFLYKIGIGRLLYI